jgi:hypothetical protein
VPKADTISVATSGIPSDTVTPGSAPTEVDVTLCNDSPVSYPAVGVVIVLDHCSCAPNPNSMTKGTIERFDAATGGWTQLDHPSAGTGMDYLGTSTNVQPLPKGKTVTLRYRIALDASMTAGKGGVSATAVIPDGPYEIGGAGQQFTVAAPTAAPAATGQTVLPFTGLDHPADVAVDNAGAVYVAGNRTGQVTTLAAGANTSAVLQVAGVQEPLGVAADTAGAVYVLDVDEVGATAAVTDRVVKLAGAPNAQTDLPLTGLKSPAGVAVDAAGSVYVVDRGNNRVHKLVS